MTKFCYYRKGEDIEIIEVPDDFKGTCEEFRRIRELKRKRETPLGFTDDEFIMNSSLIRG